MFGGEAHLFLGSENVTSQQAGLFEELNRKPNEEL